ncbi:ribosomal-protein-alanine N-acetyltransferase [Amycolatopsis bartoniae]|uniref:Ribosomal-protein-alanine acetyltransferase n=1 Tax=Amycolatopsis bartoniae TaxID=941986 RepID=A0A8H9J2K4_9PSEU|nr:ribosomal protein S18-alanine N-acetyltransferase [Amycolatopsis bartoniae]MBB2933910.1 ribosomal-protein-alanine N-acetyltransferase [Amycolatopsis bartoniae]TVT01467.1 ribosomal-protein-alanine N-acetyltransferase [Amycolatopsis bartoniae]GHF88202.1 ribosomal-protein-alanine acetyltransferase [Amycolatopsis bartoniae]
MKLAPLRRKDIGRCVEIERQLFAGDDPWSARAFQSELDAGGYYLGAYTDDDELVGYAGLVTVGRPGDFESSVHTIAVDEAHQGQGIGTALLRALLARADELRAPVFLEVRTDNDRAVDLYVRHGFVRIGVRKRYYQPSGADAYTMKRLARSEQEVG